MSIVGRVLRNRYEIIDERDKGGMSTVYLARDINLGCYWAIKRVRNSSSLDYDAFRSEVELLSSLSHSDIPRIVDKFEIDDGYYVVMDFINGISLGKKILSDGPAAEKTLVEWTKNLCDILIYLHTCGPNPIVFRDMKPDNVMLMESGRVKLIDFGISKECVRGQVQTGANVGTKGFSAPEQYKGSSNILDERTDIYSLGATMFYLATAVMPGLPPKAIPPVRTINPKLSEGLEYIINKCVQDDPDERYNNVYELLADLNDIEYMTSRYRRRVTRRFLNFISASAACVLFAVFAVTGCYGRIDSFRTKSRDNINMASLAMAEGNYTGAINHYENAIQYDPKNLAVYGDLFIAMQYEYADRVGRDIDTFCSTYIENMDYPDSYYNPKLMLIVVDYCMRYRGTRSDVYHSKAYEYLLKIRDSKAYKREEIDVDDVNMKLIMAETLYAKNTSDPRKKEDLQLNLDRYENVTDNRGASENTEKLESYYLLVKVYYKCIEDRTFEDNFACEKIENISKKVTSIRKENVGIKDFTHAQDFYVMCRDAFYNNSRFTPETPQKRRWLTQAMAAGEQLVDLAPTDIGYQLKNEEINLAIVSTYLKEPEARLDQATELLANTIATADRILDRANLDTESAFLAAMLKTRAQLYLECLKPSNKNFEETLRSYSVSLVYYNKLRESGQLREELNTMHNNLILEMQDLGGLSV